MKKVLSMLLLLSAASMITASAVTASAFKVYLNPGHGSWGPNDRPMATIPYPNLSSTGRPDTCGFYESNTNLQKVFGIFDDLRSVGVTSANIKLSRWKNGPYPYVSGASNQYQYNKQLSTICTEVNSFAPDMFLSVHSNAATDGTTTNYPLFLYRGTDGSGGDLVSGSRNLAITMWAYMKDGQNEIDYFTNTNQQIRGDITFYGSSSTYGYLGVLKHNYKGFLSEGYFHTYQPARHRALNFDYCRQEGVRYARGIRSHFSLPSPTTGDIMGTVKANSETLTNSLYTYNSAKGDDSKKPINGATVKLYQNGTLKSSYKTDNNYNGVFVFKNMAPGSYTISVIADGYSDVTNYAVTVTADKTIYPKFYMSAGQSSGTGGNDDPDPDPDEVIDPSTGTKTTGVYAYGLGVAQSGDNYTFTFSANAAASSGTLNFLNKSTGAVVGTVALGAVAQGVNTKTIAASDLPGSEGQEMKWSVTLNGTAITKVVKLNSGSTFEYTRLGVVVDNSPESDYFGRIYAFNSESASNANNGLWVYDANWARVNSTRYNGGQTFGNVWRLGIDSKGTVYVPDWNDAHSGIYLMNPSNPSGTYSQFFQGTRDSNGLFTNNGASVGGSTISATAVGEGANTKLYVFDEDISAKNIFVYNIGQSNGSIASTWGAAASKTINSSQRIFNANGQVWPDSKGGMWVSQYRGSGNNNTYAPSIIYMNSSDEVVLNAGNYADYLNGSVVAGFAVNNDNSLLAIANASGQVVLFNITWNGTTPSLSYNCKFDATPVASTSSSGSFYYQYGIYQMAFDWGNNLYVAGKNLGIYSIPGANSATTPAKAALTVTKPAAVVTPYTIKLDIDNDNYVETNNLTLSSKWVRSVKSEYDNISFDSNGLLNRGIAVVGDRVYLSGREQATTTSATYLDVLDATTGETLSRLSLGEAASVRYYPANDVMADADGNILVSNLTLNVANDPLVLFKVNTSTGAVTQVASLTSDAAVRIDHCGVYGSADGTLTVVAAGANSTKLLTWTVSGGSTTSTTVVDAAAYYPVSANSFGIAPRVMPIDANHAYVSGSTIHPTLYNLTTGAVEQSFANNADAAPAALAANGMNQFTLDGRSILLYANNGYSGGNQFVLSVNDNDNGIDGMSKSFVFPMQGLGTVNSTTLSAPCVYKVTGEKTADIYVYSAGNGIAAYTVTSTKQDAPVYDSCDVNRDGQVTVTDVTAIYNVILGTDNTYESTADTNSDGQVTVTDVTKVYSKIIGD